MTRRNPTRSAARGIRARAGKTAALLKGATLAALLLTSAPAAALDVLPRAKPDGLAVPVAAPGPAVAPVPAARPQMPAGNSPAGETVIKARYDVPAKELFGHVADPAPLKARAIGSYARGCQAGAVAMEVNGPGWQVMRLSRNRFWGQPVLVDYLEDLADDAPALGWRGLLIGDMAQPRGGPMLTGHASHQIGLDADIWLRPMPDHTMDKDERENVSAISMLRGPLDVAGADRTVDPEKFTDAHARLIRRAAKDRRVARIFVSPGIKKALCDFETGDRSWLRTVRPWWGHHYHFHVRLDCPKGSAGCKDQSPPPAGDGCGKELSWWMSDEPWVPKPKKPGAKPAKPKPPMTLAALPKDCAAVLVAN